MGLGESVLDWIYPPRCGICGLMTTAHWCPSCLGRLPYEVSSQSLSDGPLDARYGVCAYAGIAARAVRRLKYDRATNLARPMALQISGRRSELQLEPFDMIVPVPIHWTRTAYRGFNQAELIAISLGWGNPDTRALKRIRRTKPQVGLTRDQRLTNLDGAFRASSRVSGKRVLLIDDVITTGGTAIGCAEALKSAGASWVGILTYAHGHALD